MQGSVIMLFFFRGTKGKATEEEGRWWTISREGRKKGAGQPFQRCSQAVLLSNDYTQEKKLQISKKKEVRLAAGGRF